MRQRLGGDREFERQRGRSSTDRASRPRNRRRTAGRARAGSRAARRATGSPGRSGAAAPDRGRPRTAPSHDTIRKNSAPISAPPPARMASRMSRTQQGGERGHARAQPQLLWRARQADRPVARRDDHPAGREMRPHQFGQRPCDGASSAEVGSSSSQSGRLTATSRAIDSRRRCPADRYAAGRSASAPSADRFQRRRTDRRCRRDSASRTPDFPRRSAPASPRPDGRDNAPARRCRLGIAAFERQPPAGEPHQPGDQPQQRGFAGAVPPGDHQRLAGADRETRVPRRPRGRRGRRQCCRRPAASGRPISARNTNENITHVWNASSVNMASGRKRPYKPATANMRRISQHAINATSTRAGDGA